MWRDIAALIDEMVASDLLRYKQDYAVIMEFMKLKEPGLTAAGFVKNLEALCCNETKRNLPARENLNNPAIRIKKTTKNCSAVDVMGKDGKYRKNEHYTLIINKFTSSKI